MYRNTYLQLYKTTANTSPTLTLLLSHFSQIYNTLGCVLQDMQYQIGQLIPQPSANNSKDQYQKYIKKSSDKHREREIIKIESTISQNNDRNVPVLNEKPMEVRSIKSNHLDVPKKEDINQQSQDCNWMINRFMDGSSKSKDKNTGEKQQVIVERPRQKHPIGNSSFDSLFESNNQPSKNSRDSRRNDPLPSIPQVSEPSSPQPAQNTYEDFLDRIFKDGESRNSRKS